MNPNARAAYTDTSVATASPARLLVMLCERLVLDLTRAQHSLRSAELPEAHRHLVHAQDIVTELRSSLRVEVWDGGEGLASLYDYLHLQLVRANIGKDVTLVDGALRLAEDLAATWRQAALESASVA